jgi:AraC-like DNA-binding protein/tetratricopeptide (TPR) repeat protein
MLVWSLEMLAMPDLPLPRDVRKAIDLLQSDLGRHWKVTELADMCGVPRRSLEKHFRRFVGFSPLEFLRNERFDQVRRKLLRASPELNVTEIATGCGFNHLGRFALIYRNRYGESPSDTIRWGRIAGAAKSSAFRVAAQFERPALAVFPFTLVGPGSGRVSDLGNELAAALGRTGWVKIVPAPTGRYHLHGNVIDDGRGSLRIRMTLLDQSTRRYIWADCSECSVSLDPTSRDWLSTLAVGALRSVVRDAEINRASHNDPAHLSAWGLTVRALPMVLSADQKAYGAALELLERAMELAPRDPLPMSLAAWCHGLRAGHHFTNHPEAERNDALRLASNASCLSAGDPVADTMLSAAYMLAHDLDSSESHARRALAIDGGSAWGWGRVGWVYAYRGEAARAIESCQIAQALGPADPLGFLWSIGIAAANFELGHYDRAVTWYQRALSGQPKVIWINRFLAPALVMADRKEDARRSMSALRSNFPDLTIGQVRDGLPHTTRLLDRVAEGLASLGMPHS